MTSSQQIELEAAKLLQKLIQDSKDEPVKLATKLSVICQHMKMSGKEQSLPYQVISRAMETVINQHGLDRDALTSSRFPTGSGVGDASNTRSRNSDTPDSVTGANLLLSGAPVGTWQTSSSSHLKEANVASTSNRLPIGPNRVENMGPVPQGLVSQQSGKSPECGSPAVLPTEDSRSTNSQEKDTSSNKQVNKKDKRTAAKRKRPTRSNNDDQQLSDVVSSRSNSGSRKGKMASKGDIQGTHSVAGSSPAHHTDHSEQPGFSGATQEGFQALSERSTEKGTSNPSPSGTNVLGSKSVWMQTKFGQQSEIPEGISPNSSYTMSKGSFATTSTQVPDKVMEAQRSSSCGMGSPAADFSGSGGWESQNRDGIAIAGRRDIADPRELVSYGHTTKEGSAAGNLNDIKNNLETTNVRNSTSVDASRNPKPHASVYPNMPFKDHHLKQLRAQCLVFLAFRNNLAPRKFHLEVALGESYPREASRVLSENRAKDKEPSNLHEGSSMVNIPSNIGEAGKEMPAQIPHSLSPTVSHMETDSSLKDLENTTRNFSSAVSGRSAVAEEWKQHSVFNHKVEDISKSSHRRDISESVTDQVGWVNQPSALPLASNPSRPGFSTLVRTRVDGDIRNETPTSARPQHVSAPEKAAVMGKEAEKLPVGVAHGSQMEVLSPAMESVNKVSSDAGNNDPDSHTTSDTQKLAGPDGFKTIIFSETSKPGNASEMLDKASDHEGNKFISSNMTISPPKYTTSEKWIMDQQRRKLLQDKSWTLKQKKADERITKCFIKLKDSVNSSEDISAKTKSVIELKKLQLLRLQRRLRSEFLNDFFRPIASDIERLKSIKKHKHGRRAKQHEKYEQKMKEERQKRIRERQKEFFGELEVHRERLDECFKMKRERWRGFNRHIKEFHKRKERIHREKIDRIQREKINLLKNNDVEGYLRMVQDAKSDRVKQLLKETEKYLQKLGSKLQEAKSIARQFEMEMDDNRSSYLVEKSEVLTGNDEESDEAKHYLESNEKYYLMAHSVKESIEGQPATLQGGKLREYQMNGLRWLVSLYNNNLNGILADEMGLGKTVQVISLICYLMEVKNDRGPFLVVVPSSVLPGWESELSFWAPGINKIAYAGPPEERRRLFKEIIVHKKFNVLLTTYEYLMNKHDRPKLSKIQWHYVIIDEGHRIKNASCKLNADLKLYQSSHRLLLTGTPLQNNLEELWALLNFLLPSIFNSAEDFSQWFNKPFEGSADLSPDEALLSEEENLLIINRLHQVLRPFVLRRLKHKVENELPEKIERLIRCEASAYQKLLMKRVEGNLGSLGNSKGRSVHNTVMELRNICNHPYLSQLHTEEVDSLIPKHFLPPIVRLCGKLEMLDRLLPKLKATNHRVLFFSTMTRLLDIMEEYLTWKHYRYLRLDGHTSGNDRGMLIEEFNKPDSSAFIFLLSIRAGGVGVNLQAADTVIIFDTDWNPQVDLQAQARAHRIGQKREVLVLRLETVDSVEEQVRAAAEHKLGVANQSITAGFFDNHTSAEDRREYLESLLREHKKEEAAHVLDDDALNDILARSEPEIDIFEAVDKQRREEEMAVWEKMAQRTTVEGEEHVPVPSRLVTDEDLLLLYRAIKINDTANTGVKRKGNSGSLDTQHYGRGKRAREVRSYEDPWTEEEFEKLCQVDSSDSPQAEGVPNISQILKDTVGPKLNVQEAMIESSKAIDQESRSSVPEPTLQPSLPNPPTMDSPMPVKRGRGRPKRVISNVASPSSGAPGNLEIGSQTLPPPSVSTVAKDTSNSVKGGSNTTPVDHVVGTTAGSTPSCPPVTPVAVKSRGRKAKTEETPRGRGRKQISGLSTSTSGLDTVPSPQSAETVAIKSQVRTRATRKSITLGATVPSKPQPVAGSQEIVNLSSTENCNPSQLQGNKNEKKEVSDSLTSDVSIPSAAESFERLKKHDLPSAAATSVENQKDMANRESTRLKDLGILSNDGDKPFQISDSSLQTTLQVTPASHPVEDPNVKFKELKSVENMATLYDTNANKIRNTRASSLKQEMPPVPAPSGPEPGPSTQGNCVAPVIVRRRPEKKTSVTSKKAAARETKHKKGSVFSEDATCRLEALEHGSGEGSAANVSYVRSEPVMYMVGGSKIQASGSCSQMERMADKPILQGEPVKQVDPLKAGETAGLTDKRSESKDVNKMVCINDVFPDIGVVNTPPSFEAAKPVCPGRKICSSTSSVNDVKMSVGAPASSIGDVESSALLIIGTEKVVSKDILSQACIGSSAFPNPTSENDTCKAESSTMSKASCQLQLKELRSEDTPDEGTKRILTAEEAVEKRGEILESPVEKESALARVEIGTSLASDRITVCQPHHRSAPSEASEELNRQICEVTSSDVDMNKKCSAPPGFAPIVQSVFPNIITPATPSIATKDIESCSIDETSSAPVTGNSDEKILGSASAVEDAVVCGKPSCSDNPQEKNSPPPGFQLVGVSSESAPLDVSNDGEKCKSFSPAEDNSSHDQNKLTPGVEVTEPICLASPIESVVQNVILSGSAVESGNLVAEPSGLAAVAEDPTNSCSHLANSNCEIKISAEVENQCAHETVVDCNSPPGSSLLNETTTGSARLSPMQENSSKFEELSVANKSSGERHGDFSETASGATERPSAEEVKIDFPGSRAMAEVSMGTSGVDHTEQDNTSNNTEDVSVVPVDISTASPVDVTFNETHECAKADQIAGSVGEMESSCCANQCPASILPEVSPDESDVSLNVSCHKDSDVQLFASRGDDPAGEINCQPSLDVKSNLKPEKDSLLDPDCTPGSSPVNDNAVPDAMGVRDPSPPEPAKDFQTSPLNRNVMQGTVDVCHPASETNFQQSLDVKSNQPKPEKDSLLDPECIPRSSPVNDNIVPDTEGVGDPSLAEPAKDFQTSPLNNYVMRDTVDPSPEEPAKACIRDTEFDAASGDQKELLAALVNSDQLNSAFASSDINVPQSKPVAGNIVTESTSLVGQTLGCTIISGGENQSTDIVDGETARTNLAGQSMEIHLEGNVDEDVLGDEIPAVGHDYTAPLHEFASVNVEPQSQECFPKEKSLCADGMPTDKEDITNVVGIDVLDPSTSATLGSGSKVPLCHSNISDSLPVYSSEIHDHENFNPASARSEGVDLQTAKCLTKEQAACENINSMDVDEIAVESSVETSDYPMSDLDKVDHANKLNLSEDCEGPSVASGVTDQENRNPAKVIFENVDVAKQHSPPNEQDSHADANMMKIEEVPNDEDDVSHDHLISGPNEGDNKNILSCAECDHPPIASAEVHSCEENFNAASVRSDNEVVETKDCSPKVEDKLVDDIMETDQVSNAMVDTTDHPESSFSKGDKWDSISCHKDPDSSPAAPDIHSDEKTCSPFSECQNVDVLNQECLSQEDAYGDVKLMEVEEDPNAIGVDTVDHPDCPVLDKDDNQNNLSCSKKCDSQIGSPIELPLKNADLDTENACCEDVDAQTQECPKDQELSTEIENMEIRELSNDVGIELSDHPGSSNENDNQNDVSCTKDSDTPPVAAGEVQTNTESGVPASVRCENLDSSAQTKHSSSSASEGFLDDESCVPVSSSTACEHGGKDSNQISVSNETAEIPSCEGIPATCNTDDPVGATTGNGISTDACGSQRNVSESDAFQEVGNKFVTAGSTENLREYAADVPTEPCSVSEVKELPEVSDQNSQQKIEAGEMTRSQSEEEVKVHENELQILVKDPSDADHDLNSSKTDMVLLQCASEERAGVLNQSSSQPTLYVEMATSRCENEPVADVKQDELDAVHCSHAGKTDPNPSQISSENLPEALDGNPMQQISQENEVEVAQCENESPIHEKQVPDVNQELSDAGHSSFSSEVKESALQTISEEPIGAQLKNSQQKPEVDAIDLGHCEGEKVSHEKEVPDMKNETSVAQPSSCSDQADKEPPQMALD